jgi:hypothetical protein
MYVKSIVRFITVASRSVRIAIVGSMCCVFAKGEIASGRTVFRVDGEDGSTTNANPAPNGSAWGTAAYLFLQDALAAASSGGPHQIWVRSTGTSGTLIYYPDEGTGQSNNVQTSTFNLRNNVAIYGGFSGTETALGQRNPLNQAILSGDLEKDFKLGDPFASSDLSDNAYHVVTATKLNNNARIDGFLIKSGNADGSGHYDRGGGMWILEGGAKVVHCTFQHNRATSSTRGGGAIHIDGEVTVGGQRRPEFVSGGSFFF